MLHAPAPSDACVCARHHALRYLEDEVAAMGTDEQHRLEEAQLLQRLAQEEEELRAKRRQLAEDARCARRPSRLGQEVSLRVAWLRAASYRGQPDSL